jgi:hypothetical protein
MFVIPAVVALFGFSTLFNARLASSLCALLIVYQTYFDVWNGMLAFVAYIVVDSMASRKSFDILLHHVVGLLITLSGMVMLMSSHVPDTVAAVVTKLLLMEACTPLLHLNYALNVKQSRWIVCTYPLLLASWVYFRLYNPYMCIHGLWLIYDGGIAWCIVIASFVPLMIMQWYWFVKIVQIGVRKYLSM